MSNSDTSSKLLGVFPPIPTPFQNGDVAYKKLASNLKRWNGTPITGYVVLGSNGEFPLLAREEKLKVLETVAASAKPAGKVIIAGVGCESAKETIELAREVASLGADFALVVTPHYYKSKMTQEALVEYYRAVADSSPVPVLIYNMPAYTGITIQPAAANYYCSATIVSLNGIPKSISIFLASSSVFAVVTKVMFIPC